MKHIAKRFNPPKPRACTVEMTTEVFRPLSYYLNGGIDLTGDSLRQTDEVEFDNEEDFAELEEEGASSVPYGDPRVDKFQLVEDFGKHEAKKIASKSDTANSADISNAGSVE